MLHLVGCLFYYISDARLHKQQCDDFIYQQDDFPPHYHNRDCSYLNQHLPQCWIRRTNTGEKALLRWPPRSRGLTTCDFSCGEMSTTLSTACTTGSASTKKKNHRFQLRHQRWPSTVGTGGNGLSAWRLSCHKRLTHTALVRYKKIGDFFFPSLGRALQLFSAIKVYRFYEMYQGFMNNPSYYAEVNLSCACDILLVLFYRVRAVGNKWSTVKQDR